MRKIVPIIAICPLASAVQAADPTHTDYPIPAGDLHYMTIGQLQTRAVQSGHLIDRWWRLAAACNAQPQTTSCDDANRLARKLKSVGFALSDPEGVLGKLIWYDTLDHDGDE